MTDSVGVRATARQFPVSVSAVDAAKDLRQDEMARRRRYKARVFAAIDAAEISDGAARLLRRIYAHVGCDGGPDENLAHVTTSVLSKEAHQHPTKIKRLRRELLATGMISIPKRLYANDVAPDSERSTYGGHVYRVHPDVIIARAGQDATIEPPFTNVTRLEFAQERTTYDRRLEAMAEQLAQVQQQLADVAAAAAEAKRAPPPPPVVAASVAPPAPVGGTAADSREPTHKRPGGPVSRTLPDDRRLRSNVFASDPSVGIVSPPPMGSPTIPPLSLQGSQGERETKPHTAGAREPKAPTPGVCAIVDTKPHEVLRHWAGRMGVEWERDDYASPDRLRLVRGFFASRPSATLQNAKDAIDGAWLQPPSFFTARQLKTIFGEHFESFAVQGRKSRELQDEREKKRNRELEIEELETEKSAQVVPLPVEEFAKITALRGAR